MEAKSAMINNLPPHIIETILSLLPIKEAARTSILCREWKYHWTKIPKLKFVAKAVKESSNDDEDEERLSQADRELFYAINHVMSIHQGPIHEFSLFAHAHGSCVEIDHIIDNLSRNNTVKKLTLDMCGYWLPESLFSLHNLTDLYLDFCRLDVQPTFSGFGSLAVLHMEKVDLTKQMLLLFLSGCPLLKTVLLVSSCCNINRSSWAFILFEFCKLLQNPYLGRLPGIDDDDDSTVIELFECLPLIENLTVNLPTLRCFAQGRVPNKLPATLLHLKYLCIRDTLLVYEPCSAFLIRSSPNLEKLKLVIFSDLYIGIADKRESYSDMWLEHLKELEIELWTRRSYRLDFVKLILAKSPVLKKLKIVLCNKASRDEASRLQSEISGAFLLSPHASPVIEMIVRKKS